MLHVQHILMEEFMLYEFELDHNNTETIKNICSSKGPVDHMV